MILNKGLQEMTRKTEVYVAALLRYYRYNSVAGTYCDVLPSGIKSELTLNADGTYKSRLG